MSIPSIYMCEKCGSARGAHSDAACDHAIFVNKMNEMRYLEISYYLGGPYDHDAIRDAIIQSKIEKYECLTGNCMYVHGVVIKSIKDYFNSGGVFDLTLVQYLTKMFGE